MHSVILHFQTKDQVSAFIKLLNSTELIDLINENLIADCDNPKLLDVKCDIDESLSDVTFHNEEDNPLDDADLDIDNEEIGIDEENFNED